MSKAKFFAIQAARVVLALLVVLWSVLLLGMILEFARLGGNVAVSWLDIAFDIVIEAASIYGYLKVTRIVKSYTGPGSDTTESEGPIDPSEEQMPVGQPEETQIRLSELCARINSQPLDYGEYQELAQGVGARLGLRSGLLSTKYFVVQNGSNVDFSDFESLRPWFLENVVPKLERKP